jgi:23S rRNA (uracil1939-C5)-methyltransferase
MKSNTLTVEKIVNGGYGLARDDTGQVILLHNSLPGEKVRYRITDKRKKTLFGQAEPVGTTHACRIAPPCHYYGRCGGCNLQHCSYDEQLNIKTQIMTELFQGLFANIGKCTPSPEQFGYRQRIRLQIHEGTIGFLRFRSSEIVPITACLLAHSQINAALESLLQNESFQILAGSSKEIELLYNPGSKSVTLVFHCQRKPRPAEQKSAVDLVRTTDEVERIFFTGSDFSLQGPYTDGAVTSTAKKLSYLFTETSAKQAFRLSWEVGGFCQVNLRQNENLIDYIIQHCQDLSGMKVLDLFCGMGNFSIPLARIADSVIGVEGQGAAVRAARQNCAEANLTNTNFIKGASDAVCRNFHDEQRKFDVTLVDPPRQGVGSLVADLAAITRRKIIYISCDPATLVRDIISLQQHCFQLVSVQPFDMFPQTHHIEAVAILEKN